MTDLISLTLHEVWKTTQSPPKDWEDSPEGVSVLKSSFKVMGVESDSDIDTKLAKYTSELANYFVDSAETKPRLSTKLAYWNDHLKDVFPQLSTEDFNEVSSFSVFLMTSVSTTVAAYATTHETDADWGLEAALDKNQYIGMGVLVSNQMLRYTQDVTGLRELWSQPWTPNEYWLMEEGRVRSILNEADELRRPYMWTHVGDQVFRPDWQAYREDELERYAAELRPVWDAQEERRLWLRGRVNFILGDEVRAASSVVCSVFTVATSIFGLWNDKNDSWSIKSWEVAQVAVDSLALVTNGYIIAAKSERFAMITLAEASGIPILGEVFAFCGAAVAVVLIVMQGSQLSPEQTWVRDAGAHLLKTVNPPTSDWLAEHPLPSDVH
jgi:hypothetical protein